MSNNILGIEVAKLKLDVALISAGKTRTKQFNNAPQGFQLLQTWLTSFQLVQGHTCLEAIGIFVSPKNLLCGFRQRLKS